MLVETKREEKERKDRIKVEHDERKRVKLLKEEIKNKLTNC
jgi:hypothetical protein